MRKTLRTSILSSVPTYIPAILRSCKEANLYSRIMKNYPHLEDDIKEDTERFMDILDEYKDTPFRFDTYFENTNEMVKFADILNDKNLFFLIELIRVLGKKEFTYNEVVNAAENYAKMYNIDIYGKN